MKKCIIYCNRNNLNNIVSIYINIYIFYKHVFKKYSGYNDFAMAILFYFTLQSIEINISLIKNKCNANFIFYDHIFKTKDFIFCTVK